jgi:hypothetical protein
MSGMIAIKKVALNEGHLRPGRAKHTIKDSTGTREFPPFISRAIIQFPGHPCCYLMYICEDCGYADTYHESIEDAVNEAEWEFGVRPEEWADADEPF